MKYPYDIDARKQKLKALLFAIEENLETIEKALFLDLGKPAFEARVSETGYIIGDIKLFLKNMKRWSQTKSVWPSLLNFPSRDYIMNVPYGKVLVYAPWNYPFNLSLSPVIAAYAAGNSVVVKLSELAPNTASAIAQLVASVFDPDEMRVVNGDVKVASSLLEEKWDYIFFTGGISIGKKVAEAAAKTLTPTTMELGGKNPCLILDDTNLELTAKRIVWGKFFNCGQTCIAPDFVLVPSAQKSKLMEVMRTEISKSYGQDASVSPDYGRIVNTDNCIRLQKLIQDERIFSGGNSNAETRYFEPTIIDLESVETPIMSEEIFGPILPVIAYDSVLQRDEILKRFSHSLAFYVFGNDTSEAKKMIAKQPCGGACINDSVLQFANPKLPFGGIGASGYGAYHGKFGFDTFTHKKAVLQRGQWIDPSLRYPPYSAKWKLLQKILKWL
ncbi:aldehyde dehydrogenase family protein [Flavobacterium silvaticum]|uniref:Aldehyde dehydrogenase n=1 Tax=Flavobacterium silvaticum TaxID=1852020 RepID=A0A972JIX7_9FLAO|nr:aldehyde dehydrogenase family protein [Flavobacterium silvaticum]NMH28768.1 aldehyde dehydrogenase family protein [Flavobacterium silvaticum]